MSPEPTPLRTSARIPKEGTVAGVLPMGRESQGPVPAQDEQDSGARWSRQAGQCGGGEGPYRTLPPSSSSLPEAFSDWTGNMCQREERVNSDVCGGWGYRKERGQRATAAKRCRMQTDACLALNPSAESEPPPPALQGPGVGGGAGWLTTQVSLPPSRCPAHSIHSVTSWGWAVAHFSLGRRVRSTHWRSSG